MFERFTLKTMKLCVIWHWCVAPKVQELSKKKTLKSSCGLLHVWQWTINPVLALKCESCLAIVDTNDKMLKILYSSSIMHHCSEFWQPKSLSMHFVCKTDNISLSQYTLNKLPDGARWAILTPGWLTETKYGSLERNPFFSCSSPQVRGQG